MDILRVPDFLVTMTTLLTHAVGLSTFARTPRLSSRSSSALRFSLRAVGTGHEGVTDSSALSSICRCTALGMVPRSFENTSAWHWTSSCTVSIFLMSLHNCLCGGGIVMKFSPFVVLYVHLSGALNCQGRQQIQWSISFVS